MANLVQGNIAEELAANYLARAGFEIINRNWKTRVCEIDIVAQKDKRIYFIEVKYRKSNQQGTGLEYITKQKLSQMRFAAQVWISSNHWKGDYSLSAIEVSGPAFAVSDFLPDLT